MEWMLHVDGMDVVQILVRPEGIHIRVDAAAGLYPQFSQLQALPLGQGVHHLGGSLVHPLHGELHRTLHTIEVVIEALPGEHHHGCRHTQQSQLGAQVQLKHIFHGLDGLFRLLDATKQVAVIFGDIH